MPARTIGAAGVEPHELELSVVLPCLDEAETIAVTVGKALAAMDRLGIDGEVVVADNGSTDGSPDLARACGARVVCVATRGYGAALAGGIAAARGRYVVMADADDSYDLGGLEPFVDALRDGADLVMGNRFRGGIEPGAMPKLHRYVGNPVLSGLGRLFFHCPVGDFHCGMRGFRKDAIVGLDLRTTGMEFASEMVVKATLEDLVIVEVPTTLSRDGRSSAPHLRTWRDGWRHLRFLLLFSPRWLFLYPGIALFGLGAALGLALSFGPVTLAGSELDITALLYAMAMMLIGYQAILFAVFARAFTMNEGLLPSTPALERAFRTITLERGLLVGALVVLVGLGIALYGLGVWAGEDFGDLDPQETIRIAAPAATAMVLGVQTIFASFFLSVLGLARR
jgi:glycosyltransferase involved in cell wall biosynthesis